jgi:hypothetical protein
MPLDGTLPSPGLSSRPVAAEIMRHFPRAYGVRVDAAGVDLVPGQDLMGFEGARLPEPPEAVLMDRVLQLVPVELLRGIERIVMLPSRGTDRYGGYLNGIIRLSADAASRRIRDPEFGGNYSVFTTTLLHEVGHAVYQRWLTDDQRAQVIDLYLDRFIQRPPPGVPEPTTSGAEHFFVALLSSALLGAGSSWGTPRVARESLEIVGVRID